MTVSLYDVLDLDRDATPEQIRSAWKSAIAELEPGDRRFRAFNDAAEVLLDPDRRAAYDAELAEQEPPADPVAAETSIEEKAEPAAPPIGETSPADVEAGPSRLRSFSGRAASSNWLPAVLLLLTLAFAGTAAWLVYDQPSDDSVERALRTAESTAATAAPVIFSYDHRNLDDDHDRAVAYMTSDYREDYDKLFDSVIKENAPRLETTLQAELITSGIIRTGGGREADDRVDVLVVFDQLTTNKQVNEPQRSPAYAVLTMENVDGDWLVDEIKGPQVPQ